MGGIKVVNSMKKREFQKALGISHVSMSRWLKRGLPHTRATSKTVWIDVEAAILWLDQWQSVTTWQYAQTLRGGRKDGDIGRDD